MGPNNTNTPTSPPPAFSGDAPTTNPFAGQNSIPSSADGDVILSPSQPAKTSAPKKSIIFIILAAVVTVILLIILLVLSRNPSKNSANIADSGSVKSSYEDFLRLSIYGPEFSENAPADTSSTPTYWYLLSLEPDGNTQESLDYDHNYLANTKEAFDKFATLAQNSGNSELVSLVQDSYAGEVAALLSYGDLGYNYSQLESLYIANGDAAASEFLDKTYESSSADDLLTNEVLAYQQLQLQRLRLLTEAGCISLGASNPVCVEEFDNPDNSLEIQIQLSNLRQIYKDISVPAFAQTSQAITKILEEQ